MIQCQLKDVLRDKGLTQVWLANQIDVSRQHINNISSGRRPLSLDRLNDFCRLLECQPGDLLKYVPDQSDKSIDS